MIKEKLVYGIRVNQTELTLHALHCYCIAPARASPQGTLKEANWLWNPLKLQGWLKMLSIGSWQGDEMGQFDEPNIRG